MDTVLLIPICVAAAVGLGAWAFISITANPERKEKRKLAERLATEPKNDAASALQRSITLQMQANGLPPGLAANPLMQGLHRRVVQAYPDGSLKKFLMIMFACAMGCGLFGGAVFASFWAIGIGLLAGGYIPFFFLSLKRNKRQKAMVMQLPEALDFLSRILRAGHSLSTGVQMMGEELPQPIASEFRRCYDQHSLGQPLEEAFKDMATRVNSTDFAFFVTAVLIQRQTGGDLSEVLSNISDMIRGRIRLSGHVKAKTAEGRFTGYILVAFPAVMFVILGIFSKQHTDFLMHTSAGLWMLFIAFGLQMLGLLAIRMLTTIKV
jgi:tight adherence protein B